MLFISFLHFLFALCFLFFPCYATIATQIQQALNLGNLEDANRLLQSRQIDIYRERLGLGGFNQRGPVVQEQVGPDVVQVVFWRACTRGDVLDVDTLLKTRLPDLRDDLTGLYLASLHGRLEVVQSIVSNPNMNIKRSSSLDPVMASLEGNHNQVTALLLLTPRMRTGSPNRIQLQYDFIKACINGHRLQVVGLIKLDGALADADFSYGFVRACAKGHLAVVEYLLGLTENRPDPTVGNDYALRKAFEAGHYDVVALLLKENVKVRNPEMLTTAIKSGLEALAVAIIPKVSFPLKDEYLNSAIELERYSVVEAFLTGKSFDHIGLDGLLVKFLKHPQMNAILKKSKLFRAARLGSLKTIQELQSEGTDVSMENSRALRFACFNGHVDIVEYLIKNSASDPSAVNQQCIQVASQMGHLAIVKLLLQDQRVDPAANEQIPLQFACQNGFLEIVRVILEDPRIDAGANGQKAVILAVRYNHPLVVACLLREPTVNLAIKGSAILNSAAQNGHLEIVRALLKSGKVDPSASRNSAFYNALVKDHSDVAKLLWTDQRVSGDLWAKNLVMELGIRKILDARQSQPAGKLKLVLEEHLREWQLSFPVEQISNALMYPHPPEPSTMERFIMNVFFDSHSLFFHRKDIQLTDYPNLYSTFKKLLEQTLARMGLTKGTADFDRFQTAYTGVCQLLEVMEENFSLFGELTPAELERRRSYFKSRIAKMSVGQKLTFPLRTRGHVSIGVLERAMEGSWNWYIYNSGDGTATQADGPEVRQRMFEIFAGISLDWLVEMLSNLGQPADTTGAITYRSEVYPPRREYAFPYKSKATIRGQRSGSCMALSVRLFLLCTLGRPLYTEYKVTAIQILLEGVYTGLKNTYSPGFLNFLGVQFQTFYLPVWVFARSSRLVETMLKRQIGKLDDMPRITVSILEPQAYEAYNRRVQQAKAYGAKVLQQIEAFA